MIKNLLKLVFWLAVCYLALVLGRFIYLSSIKAGVPQVYIGGSSQVYDKAQMAQGYNGELAGLSFSAYGMRNFTKVKVQQAPESKLFTVQTYEKIASLSNSTESFDKDEQGLRNIIKEEQAVVQKEEASGLTGSRRIEMSIGVLPDRFDSAVDKIKKIGKLAGFSVTKTDKTNEYAELKAKKSAIEETKRSLMSLKSRNGKIDELINLENRIYEINKEMQGLGLQIGEFESTTDFCTVRVTMQETTGSGMAWANNIIDALEWALMKELIILVIIFFGMLAVWITLKVVAQAKDLNKLVEAIARKKK